MTRATMEAALAARATPLDRERLLRSVRAPQRMATPGVARFASQPIDPPAPPLDGLWADSDGRMTEVGINGPAAGVPVPELAGLPVRTAARRLHGLGLRVVHEGWGEIVGTLPTEGTRVLPGDTVRLRLAGRGDG